MVSAGAILAQAKNDSKKKYTALGDAEVRSVVSTRPVKLGDSATAPATQGMTTRFAEVAPFDIVALYLVFGNWQNAFASAEAPSYNPIRVKASVHKGGTTAPSRLAADPVVPALFGGREFGLCQPGNVLWSDRIPVSIKAGERYFHEAYADPFIGAGPTAAPTLAVSAGGSLVATTNYVAITYVYADGSESLPSPEASVATTVGQQTITVTSPPAAVGIIGYRAYFGTTAGGVKYENMTAPMAPLGTNIVIASASTPNALNRLIRTAATAGIPLGRGYLPGCGENSILGRDYTTTPADWGSSSAGSFSGTYGPLFIMAVAADGRAHTSVGLIGDSIQAGTGDGGYGGALGGFGFRACANQREQLVFDPAKTPNVPFLTLAQGGESAASFASAAGGTRRRMLLDLVTSIFDNYGTNDTGAGAAPIIANILSYTRDFIGRKKYFRATIDPKTTSTDGFKTVAAQTIGNTDAEADRRQLNNWIKSTTGATTVTDEALFRSVGTATPTDNLYSGGNASATKFFPAHSFRTGTETVKVAGAAKVVTTDYTYRGLATIDGVQYASGVTLLAAPANAATVTMSYTKVAGMGSRAGFTGYFDTATEVEVNGVGAKTANGGFWLPAESGVSITGTATSSSASTINDTARGWAVNAYAGLSLLITADATVPGAVGQVVGIQSNTATQLKLGASMSPAPSQTCSYEIFAPHVVDGVHGTSVAQRKKSLVIDTTKF